MINLLGVVPFILPIYHSDGGGSTPEGRATILGVFIIINFIYAISLVRHIILYVSNKDDRMEDSFIEYHIMGYEEFGVRVLNGVVLTIDAIVILCILGSFVGKLFL